MTKSGCQESTHSLASSSSNPPKVCCMIRKLLNEKEYVHIIPNNDELSSGCEAQLVEQLLPIPEVRSSNPVIRKNILILNKHLFTVNCVLKRQK